MIRAYSFAEVVDVLAANYAAEELRTRQRWAHDKGSSLSADQIVEIFNQNYRYMYDKIQQTSTIEVDGEDVSAPRLRRRS